MIPLLNARARANKFAVLVIRTLWTSGRHADEDEENVRGLCGVDRKPRAATSRYQEQIISARLARVPR